MAKEDWSEAKAWMRATRERIGMTQHDAAVLANLTVDMVKKYESEKYRIQPSERMRKMLEHYLAEHRRAVVVREAAVLLEAEGVAVDYTYMPEETE